MLVHDGIGIWLAARRLNEGQFVWAHASSERKQHALTQEQLAGLVVNLQEQALKRERSIALDNTVVGVIQV